MFYTWSGVPHIYSSFQSSPRVQNLRKKKAKKMGPSVKFFWPLKMHFPTKKMGSILPPKKTHLFTFFSSSAPFPKTYFCTIILKIFLQKSLLMTKAFICPMALQGMPGDCIGGIEGMLKHFDPDIVIC